MNHRVLSLLILLSGPALSFAQPRAAPQSSWRAERARLSRALVDQIVSPSRAFAAGGRLHRCVRDLDEVLGREKPEVQEAHLRYVVLGAEAAVTRVLRKTGRAAEEHLLLNEIQERRGAMENRGVATAVAAVLGATVVGVLSSSAFNHFGPVGLALTYLAGGSGVVTSTLWVGTREAPTSHVQSFLRSCAFLLSVVEPSEPRAPHPGRR